MYSTDDERIGKVGQVFLEDTTERLEFLTVDTGLFGTSASFVPGPAWRSAGHDTLGPRTDDAMPRSEEQRHADTETREAGRARRRTYVVTVNVTTTVPASRKEESSSTRAGPGRPRATPTADG